MVCCKGKIIIVGKEDDAKRSYWITRGRSVLRNPFIKGVDGDKATVIAKFEEHLFTELKNPKSEVTLKVVEYAKRVAAGETIYLRCVCKPAACHGDILKMVIEKMALEICSGVNNPENDGVTHINVYSRGRTVLGKLLSNFAEVIIDSPEYGRVHSIEGLWYYLITGEKHPELLSMSGWEAKKHGRNFSRNFTISKEEFRDKICSAITLKVMSSKRIYDLMKDSDFLPFTHYYVNDGNVRTPPNNEWILEHLEKLRKDIRDCSIKPLTKGNFGCIEFLED